MTELTIALFIVVVYIVATTLVAVNYVKNQKKEITEKYEKQIARIGGLSLSQAIEIEMLNETVRLLRFDHKACKECRKDTVQICTDYRKQIKEMTEIAENRKEINNALASEVIKLSKKS